jgi:hypothetical protein
MEIKLEKINIRYTTTSYNDYKYYIKNIDKDWNFILDGVHLILPYNKNKTIIKKLIDNNKNGLVFKFCNFNNKNILTDYNNGKKLEKIKGYIKYICYIENEYNFLNSLHNYNKYDDDLNNDCGIIIMPYYEYNMYNYEWNSSNLHDFINCLKQIILSHYVAYYKYNIINIDLNVNNVLLNKLSRKKNIEYHYDDYNINYIVNNCNLEIKIVDFFNSITVNNTNNKVNYYQFYNSLLNIFKHYIDDKYKNFININKIYDYINNIMNTDDNPMNNLKELLQMTETILYINNYYYI